MAPSFRALETAEIQERKLEDNCLNDVPFVASAATLEGSVKLPRPFKLDS
jgi:hypothetical protein